MHYAPYRSFTEAYRVHLDEQGAWPRDKQLSKWFKSHCGYTGGTNTKLRRGDLVPHKYPKWYVEMLVQMPGRLEVREARAATLGFVARFGITELTSETAPMVLGHICTPLIDAPETKTGMIDYLAHSVDILRLFQHLVSFDSHVRGCPKKHLPAAVRWMYVRVGQDCAPDGPSLTEIEAVSYACKHMAIEESEYLARATLWAKYSPWAIVRAWDERKPVGMSVVLPVTEAFYEEVRTGQRASYECASPDLEAPSLNLIIEAAAENPAILDSNRINPTRSLLVCLIHQLAALARCNRLFSPQTLRMLTFGGTPTNQDRMLRSGFLPVGVRAARTDVEMFERTIQVGGLGLDILSVMALHGVGALSPASPRMDDD